MIVVALYFLAAAIGKFIAVDEFMVSLESWSLIPQSFHPIIAIFIPSIEITLSLLVLIRISPRKACVGLLVMLVVFTVMYLYQIATSEAPDCNCLGKIKAFENFQNNTMFVIGRNLVMGVMLCLGLYMSRSEIKR